MRMYIIIFVFEVILNNNNTNYNGYIVVIYNHRISFAVINFVNNKSLCIITVCYMFSQPRHPAWRIHLMMNVEI